MTNVTFASKSSINHSGNATAARGLLANKTLHFTFCLHHAAWGHMRPHAASCGLMRPRAARHKCHPHYVDSVIPHAVR